MSLFVGVGVGARLGLRFDFGLDLGSSLRVKITTFVATLLRKTASGDSRVSRSAGVAKIPSVIAFP